MISILQKKPMRKYLKSLLALMMVPVLLLPALALADQLAVELLNRMNLALHQLNYKGALVLVQGDKVSSLHIDHSVVNGVEAERVVRLNEAGSEVSRELKGFSLSLIPRIGPEMEKVYSFDLGRQNRVANIPCRIITARPKDRERYLQKYCIDTVSGMLLDYMLVGKSHKPVEQFMFTTIEIKIPETVSKAVSDGTTTAVLDQAVTAVIPMQESNSSDNAQSESMFRQITNAALEDGWIIEALPAGFEISQAPHMKQLIDSPNDDNDDAVTKHYIVSDGLSSLSLFVSPFVENASSSAMKINSGALNVVTQQKGGHMITVVGEVPELTLKNIVKNLRKKN